MAPEKLTMPKKKQICDPGYAYNAYKEKCEGNFDTSLFLIKIYYMRNY